MATLLEKIFYKLGYQIKKRDPKQEYLDKFKKPFFVQSQLIDTKSDVTIFDVGAYDGRTSKLYNQYFPNAKIYAFEPFPETFTRLKEFAENAPYCNPFNLAISDKIGESNFYCNQFDATSSLLPNNSIDELNSAIALKNTITVKTDTIDDFSKNNGIDKINILKLDIQGGELLALKGATKMLASNSIDLIYTEIEFVELYKNQPLFDDISRFLKDYDYTFFGIYGLHNLKNGRLAWCDVIFSSSKLQTNE